ncbi:MAG: type II toxin-antitoxin system Phd/YefM family antitoxin [Caldilineaceae bacterium]|nr:type II toxin-antitoxin system Phd/YefM family antitoxin [Caldilinea sp.]MCB0135791.1 type II toxin-antitoxin system Phd/YefM family antitoxin [Caldilineaceae bacterium]
MKLVPLSQVKDHFSAYIDESRESPIVVTRNGRPVAMIIAIEDEDDLDNMLLVHNQRFVQLLEEARERVHVTGSVSLAEFRKEIDEPAPRISLVPKLVAEMKAIRTEAGITVDELLDGLEEVRRKFYEESRRRHD